MNVKELFTGVAIVIDDEINNSDERIDRIIAQIRQQNIPILKLDALPKLDTVRHFQNLSFLLLDWNLIPSISASENEGPEGIIPLSITAQAEEATLKFIEKLNKICFCPVFIFTNHHPSYVENKLSERNLFVDDKSSNIFVLSKSDLQNSGTLYGEISKRLEKNPSMYVLKEWEREYQKCKTKLFSELHSMNPLWPTIMWKTYGTDKAVQSFEMGELISRNLYSRMTPFEFESDILSKDLDSAINPLSKDELKKVLEGEKFLKLDKAYITNASTGDLFEEKYQDSGEEKSRYYLNIRAQCDLMTNKNPDLFLLPGHALESQEVEDIKDRFKNGEYLEKVNHAIVAFVAGKDIIEFKFRKPKIEKWNQMKNTRIGRLLPPYINRIQQRYSLYLQRQGLPPIPDEVIF